MMLKRDPNFTRLKRLGGRGYLGRVSYWLGVDHLLVVEVTNYNERYRRFYFRDLQAVIVQRNRQRMWWNMLLGFVALPPVLGAVATFRDGEIVVALVCAAILFLVGICIFINMVLGPTCAVHLRTAVQTQKLGGIIRWRRAELLIEIITPLIQSAQPTTVETQAIAVNVAPASTPLADSTEQPGIS